MTKLYKIKNWQDTFELRDTKRTDGPLKWIPVPTKIDGLGFGRLRQEKNAPELLAAWYLILGVAARQEREQRGTLSRDGIPLSAEDLSLITGFPVKIFNEALAFFSSPRMGWLTVEDAGDSAASCGEPAAVPPSPVLVDAATCGETGLRLDKIRLDKTRSDHTSAAEFDAVWAVYPKKSGKKEAQPEIIAAIHKHGAEKILAAVKAYASAVSRWPESDRCFVPDPVRWFRRGHYDDDPATWERRTKTPGQNLTFMR